MTSFTESFKNFYPWLPSYVYLTLRLIIFQMFLRSHVVTRPMCHERMFNRIGWSRVYNNLGRSFSLFRDKHNKERCFANTGQVLVTTAVKDGWVYGITKAILPDISKIICIYLIPLNFCAPLIFAH